MSIVGVAFVRLILFPLNVFSDIGKSLFYFNAIFVSFKMHSKKLQHIFLHESSLYLNI